MNVKSKILEINKLGNLITNYKKENKTVVHALGVFDLLHVGHIRHLELAKKQGDILIVSVTIDEFVNKGPNRPVFNENLRSYAVASLEFVDYVCFSINATSVEVINIIKPDIFVKGEEFKENKDITGGIQKETNAVEKIGGKVIYLGDVIFSSSNLINTFGINKFEKQNKFLTELKLKYKLDEILSWLDKVSDLNITVLGETILEEYIYCEGKGQSLKDPVLTVKKELSEYHPGGAMFVANILSSFIAEVNLITDLGEFKGIVNEYNILNSKIKIEDWNGKGSSYRQKLIDNDSGNKILEILNYQELNIEGNKLPRELDINNEIIFISDHGLGFIDNVMAKNLSITCAFIALNIQCNPENRGVNTIKKYQKANHCCMSGHELDLEIRTKNYEIKNSIDEFTKLIDCKNLTITNGRNGTQHITSNKKQIVVPAFANKVKDRVGAVDVVFAISSMLVKVGAPWDIVGFYSNLASAIHIAENGNQKSVNKEKLIRFTTSILK